MWTRKELKTNAKAVLKNIYWKAFWISIVIAIAGGSYGKNYNIYRRNINHTTTDQYYFNIGPFNYNVTGSQLFSFLRSLFIIIIAISILATLLRIVIGYALQVGGLKYFIQSAQNEDNANCFSFAFNIDNYKGIVLTMLLRAVQNFLWALLLIIPGIVKAYAYRMVPYILADNPNIGASRAIELSNRMTQGHKFDIFVLDLSFIGWYLLGSLVVIGGVFVMPYEIATNTELYLLLRKNSMDGSYNTYENIILNQNNQIENE